MLVAVQFSFSPVLRFSQVSQQTKRLSHNTQYSGLSVVVLRKGLNTRRFTNSQFCHPRVKPTGRQNKILSLGRNACYSWFLAVVMSLGQYIQWFKILVKDIFTFKKCLCSFLYKLKSLSANILKVRERLSYRDVAKER